VFGKNMSPTIKRILEAADILRGKAHVTPVLTSRRLSELAGNDIFCKGEHLQRVGAFKFRGAFHAVSRLSEGQLKQGLITQSSGNHAQALALAGKLHRAAVHIVMPTQAPEVKKQAVTAYGATIHWCGNRQSDRERVLEEVRTQTGAYYIPPYDHPDVITGQGTVALECLDQILDLDVVVAPVGGGGLLGGIALAIKSLRPRIKVFGAEPAGADDAARSLAKGELLPQLQPDTIADGLLTSLGEWTWPLVRDYVDGIVTVKDPAILESMRLIWGWMKQIVEPSGSVALAAVLSEEFRSQFKGSRIGVVLSGGNVALDFFESRSNLDVP
jgi:threonine dehydratase